MPNDVVMMKIVKNTVKQTLTYSYLNSTEMRFLRRIQRKKCIRVETYKEELKIIPVEERI